MTEMVEDIALDVNVDSLASWIGGIPFEAWPQQNRLADGRLRPAMVTDLAWHGFGERTDSLVSSIMTLFPGCEPHNRMLSVVMPGAGIDPHRDQQMPEWVTRVHVPILTNDRAIMPMAGQFFRLARGRAYRVNTRMEHAIVNDGETPRVHFMVDIRRGREDNG